MTLQEGEYQIPNGYSVKKVGRTLQVYKSKGKRLGEGEYRCKDCKHYVSGYSSNSAWFETMLPAFPFNDDKERQVSIGRALIVYEMGIKDGINE